MFSNSLNLNRTFDSLQRRSTLSLGNTLLASYAYGATDGRLATLDNGAAVLAYSYVPGTNRLAKREWTSDDAFFGSQGNIWNAQKEMFADGLSTIDFTPGPAGRRGSGRSAGQYFQKRKATS